MRKKRGQNKAGNIRMRRYDVERNIRTRENKIRNGRMRGRKQKEMEIEKLKHEKLRLEIGENDKKN